MKTTTTKKATSPKKTKAVVNKKIQKTDKKVKSETPKKTDYPAWTMPEHLSESDHKALKSFYELFISGKIISAFSFASNFDTIVIEAIPTEIWKQSGGSLTPKGEEELQKIEKKVAKHPSPSQDDDTDKKPEPVEIKFKSDQELEQLILVNSKTFFGEDSLFFKDKNEVRNEHFPDKFLLDFSNSEKPRIYLIEVILPEQSFGQSFVRITHFFALLRNKKNHEELIWKLFEIINSNKELKRELQTHTPKDIEIPEFLATLLDNRPLVLLITDGEKSELSLLVETYIETWGKMLKTLIIRKYSDEGSEVYPTSPAFADLLKNDKGKPEVVKCTEEDHLNTTSETVRNIYNEIKTALLNADDSIEFRAKKIYISVRKNKNLAFFHLRKKISLVVMSAEDFTRTQIKHHEIKSLPASVQKFWNGPSCTIIIENSANLAEVINLLKKMIAKA
jgi:predicted transport protein